MAPLRKAPATQNSGRESKSFGDLQQYGRSESQLGVERDTAEFRSRASSSPTTRRNTSTPMIHKTTEGTSELERRLSALNETRRATYTPAIPSLNPASSLSSLNSSDGKATTAGDVSPVQKSSSDSYARDQMSTKIPLAMRGKSSSGSLLPPTPLLRNVAAPIGILEGPQRPETPKFLKDLGRDYSRYPASSTSWSNSRQRGKIKHKLLLAAPLPQTTTNNPFSDSQAEVEKWNYPDDRIGAFEPYYGGEKGFILYCNEIEDDDPLHLPKDDDDFTFKPRFSEYLERRTLVPAIGGVLLTLGLICVFIVVPVLTYTTDIYLLDDSRAPGASIVDTGPAWAHINNNTYPLLKNVRKELIDPDTPLDVRTRKSTFNDSMLQLVFSDEFSKPNRTFYAEDDPFWTAPDIWYGATQDLEWYDPAAVTTGNGTLQLRMDRFANHNLNFRSGMLNSWNQLCFKGGVFEVSVSLAGPAGIPGLWPGAWSLGNLGRPGYKATTEGVWPYTYNSCDVGITPNQSSPDGLSHLPGQKLSSCTCSDADHPNPGVGRGAPEIDILEGSVDPNNRIGVVTQSYQVAPFDIFYRPNSDFLQIPDYNTTQMNGYCGGPFQQAVSGTTLLNNTWYDRKQFQKYAFEYVPGTDEGKIAWFVGEKQSFMMDGRAIGPNGNVAARQVSEEPMSMVLNLGISNSWSEILMGELQFPTVMHVDYVRIYQRAGEESITCDPPGYPTTEYIKNHPIAYRNPNLTMWDETGYGWPKNKLTGC